VIVAITKTLPPAAVTAARAAGLTDVGENYVQEARDKRAHVGEALRWHLVGSLQRNKVRLAVRLFDYIHSIDSASVASALDGAAAGRAEALPVLVQVNTTAEHERRGIAPESVAALVEHLATCRALAPAGLMTIAPPGTAPEQGRPHFRMLRELRDDVADRLGLELRHLSMGMSEDFLVAVEEGATMVRLGRALFGRRNAGPWREES